MYPSASQPNIRPRGVDSTAARVLVVDDEQYMCDVCSRTLQRSGYEVVTTNSPDTAVQLLHGDTRFDLLLTDIKMPSMSGLDLARVARERDPAIAIIIMTGFASQENLQLSVQRGVADFLQKPFEVEHLRIAVDQALDKRSIVQDNLRLRALGQILANSATLNSTLDLQELGGTLLRLTMEQSGCRVGFVFVQAGDTVIPSSDTAELLSAGRDLVQHAMTQPAAVEVYDQALCRIDGAELRYGFALALHAQREVSGVLLLCDDLPATLRTGVPEEIALLASHAGAALRNATLYSQLNEAYAHLQELDRLKSEFIAIASHELRTPLSVVLGYSLMLRGQAPNDVFSEYVSRVLENAQRIRHIVDDMVSLRHLDTGESRPAFEPVTLQHIVRHAYDQMLLIAAERRQQMTLELPEQPIELETDSEKLQLILGHLIANAVRFTPEAGLITLRAMQRPAGALLNIKGEAVAAESRVPWAIFEVQDSGIGIPEREQSRIFERFYQVAESLTRDHGGIGLGLAIVRELTAALGGVIWVISQEGVGSTFTLALPCRPA
ncbi:MAG: response regulator [Roseiflexaceae bacterium]|nr:response regulator [Roseiflexaceae bacterium]